MMAPRTGNAGAWEHGIDPRKAPIAIGCNPDTVMKYYVKLDEQAVTDEVIRQLADCLGAPKKEAGGSGGTGGGSGDSPTI